MRALPAFALATLLACSSKSEREDKQEECDAIAERIRSEARTARVPPDGACNVASVQSLVQACSELSRCNRELADL